MDGKTRRFIVTKYTVFRIYKIGDENMKPFQKVRLLTDKYVDEGIKKGDIGVILEDYDGENFEVEFSDSNGITIALFAFSRNVLELAE